MSDLDKIISAVEFSADTIVKDMNRQYPKPRVRCTVCGDYRLASWKYLKTGWPKCHGLTMRLETQPHIALEATHNTGKDEG